MRPYLDSWYSLATWDSLTNSTTVQPVFFIVIDFGTPSLLPITSIYADGSGWTTGGIVQDINFPTESINGDKSGFSISLTGLDSNTLTYALNARQDKSWPNSSYDIPGGTIDMWFFDDDGHINSLASYTVATGIMDSCEISHGGSGTIVEFHFQSASDWLWDRPIEGRYTDAHQKSLPNYVAPIGPSYGAGSHFSGDKGFEFVEALQNWQLFWAKPTPHKKPNKNVESGKPAKRNRRRRK